MRVVLAPDAFKDCLSAPAVCKALEQGVLTARPGAEVLCVPLADGGEGTAACFAAGCGGKQLPVQVTDAYFRKKTGFLAVSPDGETVLVEMAQASGIQGIDKKHLCTRKATTYGTGELLAAAVRLAPKQIVVGLGGSATTDGGMGALAALGVQFLDRNGEALSPVGENMARVRTVVPPEEKPGAGIAFRFACDVTNPFFGETGAAAVFAPQKGAAAKDIALLDRGLCNLAARYEDAFGCTVAALPGAGSAADCMRFSAAKSSADFPCCRRFAGWKAGCRARIWLLRARDGRMRRLRSASCLRVFAGLRKSTACRARWSAVQFRRTLTRRNPALPACARCKRRKCQPKMLFCTLPRCCRQRRSR